MVNNSIAKKNNKTKEAIDNSVKYLINQHGIDNLTIKQICEHAEVSRTNFYYYYKNKDEAVLERFNYIDEYFATIVKPNLTSSNLSENLVLYANYYMKFILKFNVDYCKQIYICQIKYSNSKITSYERPVYKILIDLFDRFKSSNENLKNENSCYLADSFLTIIRGITFNWLICNGNFNLELTGEKLIKIFLNGLL
ncbi:TetR/AcrR family transcriptional regulator [Natronincola ferrireducens]|uniref:Transcriptional regulator, TetR family n=1 Tax=Natronincola ferrireducens TaxID=393762 RepID=A0A1G9GI14_9FIRM|nr:TetR/AcrR family transcriptional regulator [Natronincola ferrireducens]SDL00321.1 transcriptional regulator, TetR family [Natronincola ferrireducens]